MRLLPEQGQRRRPLLNVSVRPLQRSPGRPRGEGAILPRASWHDYILYRSASCSNRCKFCQNWHLSQRSFEKTDHVAITPAQTAELAQRMGCDSVLFTYNGPTVIYEHMFDIASIAKEVGMCTLLDTNGGMNEAPLGALLERMDAVTVDLKAFTPEFYRDVSSSELEPVLRTLEQIHDSGRHLEIVNLVIPSTTVQTTSSACAGGSATR